MKMVDEEDEVVEMATAPELEKVNDGYGDKFFLVPLGDLITKGRLYPAGVKIYGRSLTVPEVKKLSTIMMSPETADYVINDILKNAIKGIDTQALYVADKMYLLLMLRAATFKDTAYTVDFFCDKCEKKANYHFSMNNITANFLPDEYNPKTEYVLNNGDKITIKYLTVRDQNNIDKLKSSLNSKQDVLDDEFLEVASRIGTVNGEKKSLEAMYEYLTSEVDPEDYSDIKTVLDESEIGIEPAMSVVCSECGGTGQIPVNFLPKFILPKRRV